MKQLLLVLTLLGPFSWVCGQSDAPSTSRCHAYIDYEFIWTLEMVQSQAGKRVPILNVISFRSGEWEFRPNQVHLYNKDKREAKVEKFSIDTGIPEEPYLTEFIKILGNSFIGFDLIGRFDQFPELSQVAIDLGEHRFILQPLDCLQFEALVDKINNVNFDSPDVREDFLVLRIDPLGKKDVRPRR